MAADTTAHTPHVPSADLRPPRSEVGVVGWLSKNLFSSWSNTLLTLLGLWVTWRVLSGVLDWAVFSAVWTGNDGNDCRVPDAGACWPFVTAKFGQFMYGRYPDAERWRVLLTYAMTAITLGALMLPAATLQGLVWLLTARWLQQHLGRTPGLRLLAPLGVMAAVALVLYGSFLGTEGPVYRLLRQYGTVVYFGFTCLCMLLAGGAVQKLAAAGVLRLPRLLEVTMLVLAAALVLLGLGNAIVAAVLGGEWKARIENVTEWWAALIFVAVFLALAAMWARLKLRLTLSR